MVDCFLVTMIFSVPVFALLIVKAWRRKKFVKEIYIDIGAFIVFYIISILFSTVFLILYFLQNLSTLSLVASLVFEVSILSIFVVNATFCIFLNKKNILVQRTLLATKEILLDEDVNIIEKIDKMIIKSKKESIILDYRRYAGDINALIRKIMQTKQEMNEQ